MQPNRKKPNWLEIILLALPFLFLLATWDKFPARIPIHWNIHGRIDGWASKPFGLLMLPFTSLFLYALIWFLPQIDPRIRRSTGGEYDRTLATTRLIRSAMLVFMLGMFSLQVAAALGCRVAMDRYAFNGVLILFVVMGNYLTHLRPNYFVGIRTPWTLDNPETWRATHRIGGRIMVFGGLLLIPTQLVVAQSTLLVLLMVCLFGFAGWSYLYRRLRGTDRK